jgi:hypothetical protein
MAVRRALAAVGLAIAALSCGGAPPPPAPAPPRGSAPWRYAVAAGAGARELAIEAAIPPGPARRLSVVDGTEPFVRDVEFAPPGGELEPIAEGSAMWTVPACPGAPPAGCRLRYRFLLGEAALAFDSVDYAQDHNGALLSPPSSWLLRPVDDAADPDETRFTLRVTTPSGISFVTGLFPSRSDPGAFEASLGDLPSAPYSAFGPMELRRLDAGGGAVQVALLPGRVDLDEASVLGWVTDAARSVAGYYGHFPVPHVLVLVAPVQGSGTGSASTMGNGGAAIIARLGRASTQRDLSESWEMTHEMIHTAFPNLVRRHAWLEEGLATYVEPIARARLGLIDAADVWRDLARGLPKGLPMEGDRGLDHTPTWGRTYWGGALFCLLADLEIRERTGNARSLDDALRGILAAGGDISVRWDIARALDAGDHATGVPVLSELYARMKDAPVDVDLDALFGRLGVRFISGRVLYDDGAPLARIRASITERVEIAGGVPGDTVSLVGGGAPPRGSLRP